MKGLVGGPLLVGGLGPGPPGPPLKSGPVNGSLAVTHDALTHFHLCLAWCDIVIVQLQ